VSNFSANSSSSSSNNSNSNNKSNNCKPTSITNNDDRIMGRNDPPVAFLAGALTAAVVTVFAYRKKIDSSESE